MTLSGMMERDERKRIVIEVSKRLSRLPKLENPTAPGLVQRTPIFWLRGIRHKDGVNLHQALVRNVRTCHCDEKGKYQASGPREMKRTDARYRGGVARSSGDDS